MDVAYTVETLPSRAETDSAKNDALKSARYFYDLELNADGEIIGGEWYHNNHPDFLWTPPKNERALSAVDRYGQQVTLKDGRLNPRYRFDFNRALGLSAKEANQYVANSWDPHEPLPKAWQAAAKSALYQSSGQPLTKIVEDLIAFSRLAEVIGEDPSLDNGSDSENK